MIEVRSVTKTYGKKHNAFTALDDVTFSIPDGATVAILGKSGSGKSTLMHAMSGLDRPEAGEVVIDGRDILKLSQKQIDSFRSHRMSFIFQSFFVQANESCYDNVSLPLEIANIPQRVREKKILAALEAVELSDKRKSRARDLSGGQKQRLAIARAIVNNPKILFADEPTGNLDSTTGAVIEDLLFGYSKNNGATLIIVTHDPELAAKCDMRVHIKDGKIEKIETKGRSK
ncbi:MAG TPA: ABC transporter ATP-binding protein [Candidatus Saccharimonadales bacterium]